jgi:hypothetical protein
VWFPKRRRRSASHDESLIEFTVPGNGALVADASETVKLRLAAEEVGGASFELADRDGDLAITLNLPGLEPADRVRAMERFCRLAGLPLPD